MRRLWHRLAHATGQNYGNVDSFWDGDRLMMCFRCSYCDQLQGVHEFITTRQRPGTAPHRRSEPMTSAEQPEDDRYQVEINPEWPSDLVWVTTDHHDNPCPVCGWMIITAPQPLRERGAYDMMCRCLKGAIHYMPPEDLARIRGAER